MELLYSLSPNWEPIPDLTKRWSRKPDADEVADAENSDRHMIQRVVTERWGYESLDEDRPEAHSYYLVSEPEVGQSTLRIYYRHWESYSPETEKTEKPASDKADAEAIFDAFMRKKSLAIIDEEFMNLDLVSGHDNDQMEALERAITFESGDVTGYWVPLPWDYDEGRFYCFRDGHRTTESGEENDHICMRDDVAEYFLEHWGADND